MLPIILSDRLRGELESLVAHTPSAKERCRAQALLWLAEGRSVEEVAELLHVSRQTVYNWADRFQRARRARPAGAPPATPRARAARGRRRGSSTR